MALQQVPDLLQEIESGEGLTLPEVGRSFPGRSRGRGVNPSTVFRWIARGVRMKTGQKLRLEATRLGTRWLTSRSAVNRFMAALTVDGLSETAIEVRSPASRNKASEKAAEALKRMGA